MEKLSTLAQSQPQAAYACFTDGQQHKFNYFLRTIPGLETFLKPLDDVINHNFLPALFGVVIPERLRSLLALPVREGGVGIPVLCKKAKIAFEASRLLTGPLQNALISQDTEIPSSNSRNGAKAASRALLAESDSKACSEVMHKLSTSEMRLVEQCKEKGASSWLSVLPLKSQGFVLSKAEFQDALALRCNLPINDLAPNCSCGEAFNGWRTSGRGGGTTPWGIFYIKTTTNSIDLKF